MSGYDEPIGKPIADKSLLANTTRRTRDLDRLERYANGTQYEGKPSFWNDALPLFDRAPCIVLPVAQWAIESHATMVVGDTRFPVISSHGEEDDSDFDDVFGLDEESSKTLDRFVKKVQQQTRLETVCDELLQAALRSRTAVAIACVREGRLCIETAAAKNCKPTFDPVRPGVVQSLEIRYPYLEEYTDGRENKPAVRCLIYRRVINETSDVTYMPARASTNGGEPDAWTPDSTKSVEHGLGFCPVIWYRFLKNCSAPTSIDGVALHELLLDEIDALNYSVSQRHRATMSTTDPILAEIGVDSDFNPSQLVDQAKSIYQPDVGDHLDNKNWRPPAPSTQVTQGRKRSPGMAYQYPKGASVQLLTLPGDALGAAAANSADIEAKIYEGLHYVPMDPNAMKVMTTVSGKALEWLHKKQIDFCKKIRTDFGDGCLLPLVDMLLRLVQVKGERGEGLYIAGVKKVLPILKGFWREQATLAPSNDGAQATRLVWMTPDFALQWPPFFAATDVDQKAVGDNVRADLGVGLITKTTAVAKIAPFYGIDNPDAYVDALNDEQREHMASMHAANALLQGPPTTKAATKQKKASSAPAPDEEPPPSSKAQRSAA